MEIKLCKFKNFEPFIPIKLFGIIFSSFMYLTLFHPTDIKIVLDLVPNHTSNESMWFQEALNGNEKYYNYFVWEDGVIDENGNRQPPNNWVSIF